MGLRENLRTDPISDLTLRPGIAVPSQTPLRQAVDLMRENRIGAVVVVDSGNIPIGMFTEKLLIRVLARRAEAMNEPVGNHMSQRVVCLERDKSISMLIHTMQTHSLRWVCVVDDAGHPVALAGLRGVIEYVVDHFPRLVKVQPIETHLSMQQREGA